MSEDEKHKERKRHASLAGHAQKAHHTLRDMKRNAFSMKKGKYG